MPGWWASMSAQNSLPQPCGERLQAVVVQGRLALLQVVDQQVAHRAAGKPVAVDHLLGRALAGGA